MRKAVLYQMMSLDGVAEEPGDWFFEQDDAFFENMSQIIGDQDDVLMGRKTYEYWVDYWPTSEFEPFASFINRTEKHVFTSTPLTKEWSHSTPVGSPAAAYVAQLKQGPGQDIGIHGSIDLARSLLRARLVDELRLVIAPTIAASGRRLFESDDALQKLDMVDVVRTPTGALLAHYRLKAPQADSR